MPTYRELTTALDDLCEAVEKGQNVPRKLALAKALRVGKKRGRPKGSKTKKGKR